MKKNYPLYIIGSSISAKDREAFNLFITHKNFKEDVIYVDVESEDVNIQNKHAVVAVGGKALKAIIKDIKDTKIYDITRVLGCDLTDVKSKFFLRNIPHSFTEMLANPENKKEVWKKIGEIIKTYNEVINTEDEEVIEQEESLPIETVTVTTFSCQEVVEKLSEQILLNDASLTKSLSKYEKIKLNTANGILYVYPTNRISEDDEMSVTLKDLLVLLKISETLGVNSFSFEKRDGTSVSSN